MNVFLAFGSNKWVWSPSTNEKLKSWKAYKIYWHKTTKEALKYHLKLKNLRQEEIKHLNEVVNLCFTCFYFTFFCSSNKMKTNFWTLEKRYQKLMSLKFNKSSQATHKIQKDQSQRGVRVTKICFVYKMLSVIW